MTLARESAANAPIVARLTKKALYKGDADPLAAAMAIESAYQAYTWTTEDAREGVTAMTEKRTPSFL